MKTISDEILQIAKFASLKVYYYNDTIILRHKFHFKDKSLIGVLIFMFGGLFFMIVPFIKTSDLFTKVAGLIIGVSFLILSVITIVRQLADYIKIAKKELLVRHNLKSKKIELNKFSEVIMKTNVVKLNRVGTVGSKYFVVNHFLKDTNDTVSIFTFQMDNANSSKAEILGNFITKSIQENL